jgi:hypothetical protein
VSKSAKVVLGAVNEFDPDGNCDDLDEAKDVAGGFLVSRGNPTQSLSRLK